jgi:hypothetical protein
LKSPADTIAELTHPLMTGVFNHGVLVSACDTPTAS